MRSGSEITTPTSPSLRSDLDHNLPPLNQHAFAKRMAALFFGVIAALVVFEIGFRISNSAIPKPTKWSDRPAVFYLPELSHNRDRIYSLVKPADTFRIVVVGDSFTEPGDNQYDDSFSKRLERMLNLNAQQRRVEVMNWGMPGYSTAQEATIVQRAVSEFQPDLIILQITLNDPELAPYRVTHDVKKPRRTEGGLLKHWQSLAFLVNRVSNSRSRTAYVRYYRDLFEQPETWNHFSQSIEKISKITESAGVPLMAVLFPLFSHPLDDSYPFSSLHQKVTGLLGSLGIKELDLFPFYRGIPPERLQVRPGKDTHPNEIAHRIAADAIYSAMANFKLIPSEVRGKVRSRERYARTGKTLRSHTEPLAEADLSTNPSAH